MSHEVGVAWKIKVRRGRVPNVEIEVVGMNPDTTKALFEELAKKYMR